MMGNQRAIAAWFSILRPPVRDRNFHAHHRENRLFDRSAAHRFALLHDASAGFARLFF
jgi:hypothetical protein